MNSWGYVLIGVGLGFVAALLVGAGALTTGGLPALIVLLLAFAGSVLMSIGVIAEGVRIGLRTYADDGLLANVHEVNAE